MTDRPERYHVNEIFYTLQGEGRRAGTANVFIRFARCNLTCNVLEHGFDCDTEFTSGRYLQASEVAAEALDTCGGKCRAVVFTGGEPTLQLDKALCDALIRVGFSYFAIETNGTNAIPPGVELQFVTVSPKTAEHTLRIGGPVSELKYVRRYGQGIPRPRLHAEYRYISPAFDAHALDPKDLDWCIQLVKQHPEWSLSLQQHKIWGIR